MGQLSQPIPIYPGMDLVLKFLRLQGTQSLTLGGSPTGGTLTLAYRGAPTLALPYNASALQVQAAMEALATVRPGNLIGTGGPWPGTPIVLTPNGLLAASDFVNNPVTATLTGLTGGASYTLAVALPVQNITGYTYAMEARADPADPTPEINVTSAGTGQGLITNGGVTGLITVTVNHATTAALDFSTGAGQARMLLAEIISGVYTAIVTGQFVLQALVFS